MHSSVSALIRRLRHAPQALLLATVVMTPAIASAAAPAATQRATGRVVGQACLPAGQGPGATPAISFGRMGGNIRPLEVAIYADGTITYQGATPSVSNYAISPAAVVGLQRLAGAEGFWTLPAALTSSGVLPDVATLFITMQLGCGTATTTVRAHGGPFAGFTELYDTLQAATALGGGQSPAVTTPAPVPGPSAITLANDRQQLQYTVGQRFVLRLGTGYQWMLSMGTQGIFTRVPNVAMILGAQGIYLATAAGQTTLTATGTPVCAAGQACSQLVRTFMVTLIARPKM